MEENLGVDYLDFEFIVCESGISRTSPTLCEILPDGFEFTQSTEQAYYFIEDINIGDTHDDNYWLLSYCNDEIVGARYWNDEMVDVPAMGQDGSEGTSGYCTVGDVPDFKLYVESTSEIIELMIDNIPEWNSNGIFLLDSISIVETIVPTELTLLPAYPNPFNPITTIEFTVAEQMEVSLIVYDMLGRESVVLNDGILKEGFHSVIWNANNHSSGVYFIKMDVNGFSSTQKVMLVK